MVGWLIEYFMVYVVSALRPIRGIRPVQPPYPTVGVLIRIWRLVEASRRRTSQQLRTDVCRAIVRFVFNVNLGEERICVCLIIYSIMNILGCNLGCNHKGSLGFPGWIGD